MVAPDHVKGYIYVEAYKQTHVKSAIEGIGNLRMGLWNQQMVPIKEMTDVLKVVKEVTNLKPKSWVRLKRGLYKDDIAQVRQQGGGAWAGAGSGGRSLLLTVDPWICPGGLCGAESEHHLPEDDPTDRPGPHQGQDEPGRTEARSAPLHGVQAHAHTCLPVSRKTGSPRGRSSRGLVRGCLTQRRSGTAATGPEVRLSDQ